MPDSGAGELRGLRGEARIVAEPDGGHTFTLDDDLDERTRPLKMLTLVGPGAVAGRRSLLPHPRAS